MKVAPPIVTPADRAVAVFVAAVKPIDPLPLPLVVVSVIHVADLLALHAHPEGAMIPIVPDPPAAGIDAVDCWSETVHPGDGDAEP